MFMVMYCQVVTIHTWFTEFDHFMTHWPLICTKNKSCFTAHIYYILCPVLILKHGTGLARNNLLDICTLMSSVFRVPSPIKINTKLLSIKLITPYIIINSLSPNRLLFQRRQTCEFYIGKAISLLMSTTLGFRYHLSCSFINRKTCYHFVV